MSLYDVIFWLLVLLIAALAFAIESGITARHKRVVLSSMFTAMITAGYMMFALEDNSAFNFTPPPPPPKEKAKIAAVASDTNGGPGEAEITKIDTSNPDDDKLSEAQRLLSMSGGFTECPACPLMIGVEAGSYKIGSPQDETGRQPGEGPRKTIHIAKPFAVSRYEIKRVEYAAFIKQSRHRSARRCYVDGRQSEDANWINPGFGQGDHHPVVCISWDDAKAYADWLSAKTKRTYRLLTEAEWEYMARGGTTGAYWQGPAFGHETALFGGLHKGTKNSGTYPENPWKIFDVSGSAWEFTSDCYTPNLTRTPANATLPVVIPQCMARVVRGGGWDSPAERVRSASRQGMQVRFGANNTGIRVARVLDKGEPADEMKPKRKKRRSAARAPAASGKSLAPLAK